MPRTPDGWTKTRSVKGLSRDDLYELLEWCRSHRVHVKDCNGADSATVLLPLYLIEGFDLCYAKELVRDYGIAEVQ